MIEEETQCKIESKNQMKSPAECALSTLISGGTFTSANKFCTYTQ